MVPAEPVAGFLAFAGFAAALAAVGTTFLGAALPKAPFASLERSAIAGPAPALAWVAFAGAAFDLGAGFLALVAIGRNPSVAKYGEMPCRDNGLKVLRFPLGIAEN
jgi:hypothetical protein